MDGFGDGNHGHCRSEHVLDGTEVRNARPSKLEIEDILCIWRSSQWVGIFSEQERFNLALYTRIVMIFLLHIESELQG